MAETQQKALTRQVRELSKLVEAQSLQLADQSKAMDKQSAQVAEQAAKLAELQGASEGARPTSPVPDVRLPGSYSVSASRQNVPKFHGEAPQYPMWRKKILSHLSIFGRREAVAPRAQPILVGDDRVIPIELRRVHSRHELEPFWSKELLSLLWSIRSFRQGRRAAAGKSSRIGFSQEGLPNKMYGLKKSRTCECRKGKNRLRGSIASTMS